MAELVVAELMLAATVTLMPMDIGGATTELRLPCDVDGGVLTDESIEHFPYAVLHPVPQYPSPVPQYPYWLQQSPKAEPTQL